MKPDDRGLRHLIRTHPDGDHVRFVLDASPLVRVYLDKSTTFQGPIAEAEARTLEAMARALLPPAHRPQRDWLGAFARVAIRDEDARAMMLEARIARDRELAACGEDRFGRATIHVFALLGFAWLFVSYVMHAVRGIVVRHPAR